MTHLRQIFALAIGLLLVSAYPAQAQLFGPKFRAYIFAAPEKNLTGVRKLAIMNFDNLSSKGAQNAGVDLGTKMNDYLTEQLLMEFRGVQDKNGIHMNGARTNVFDLIERGRLDQVMQEQKLTVSGAVDESTAAQIGKLLGVDAIIVGSISYTSKDETDQRNETDSKTKKTYTVYGLRRTVNTEVRMKIVSVETAQVLGTTSSQQMAADYKQSRSPVNPTEVAPAAQLADQCARGLSVKLADYFSPTFQHNTFAIERIKVKELKDRAKEGEDYLERGEVDKAFQLYEAIYKEDSYNPQVAYNLGIIYEVIGNFEKAFECYSVAHELEADDKTFFRAYQRAKNGKEMAEDLKKIGINIEPKIMRSGGSDVLAKKVEVRGGKNDRVTVYAEPNTSSSVVAKIPGGLKLSVIAEAEGWLLVKLMGEKQGYISAKDVREE